MNATHLPEPIHLIQLKLSVAVKDLEAHIDDCVTLGDAISIWQQCRRLEAAFTALSDHAAAKAETLQETK